MTLPGMRWLYFVAIVVLIQSESVRSANHTDSGRCPGELWEGNSPWIPRHYSIYLELNPILKTFKGQVNITGTLNSGSKTVDLHCVNLNVSSVAVNHQKLNDTQWKVHTTPGFLGIDVPDDFVDTNESLIVSVSYDGLFNDAAGVLMHNYDKSDENRWIIFSYLQPTFARTLFPCVDLPKYKATFDVSIKNPGRVVLSNMPSKSENDSEIIEFHTTPLMSTYLVAFVVCDYEPMRIEDEKYSWRNITTWVPREYKENHDIHQVVESTPRLLEALENYMENEFSLPKLDQYLIRGVKSAGMENWGLIMYEETSLLADPEQPPKLDLFTIVTHELSHHWIGNSVTMADWCVFWVQEALPTYLQGFILSQINAAGTDISSTPNSVNFEIDPVDKVKWKARTIVMDNECFFYDISDSLELLDFPEADEEVTTFSLTRYYKGASFFYMLESVVTPAVFKDSLLSFIDKYNNSYATGKDLWEIMEKQAHDAKIDFSTDLSLADFAETWATSKSHPVVHIYRTEEGTMRAKQEVCIQKYIMYGSWWIPITYTTNRSTPDFTDTSTKLWISPYPPTESYQNLPVELEGNEWILLNILGTGFYRVQYDPITWNLLAEQLKSNHELIPPINRAILIDDSFHTAKNAEDLNRAFAIMEYAEREYSPLVWDAIFMNFEFRYRAFPKAEKELFKLYMQRLLRPNLFGNVTDLLAWECAKAESADDRWLRQLVFDLSCSVELLECLDFSVTIASRVYNGSMSEKSIPPEIRKTLWCTAVKHGPLFIYDYLKDKYDKEEKSKRRDENKRTKIFERLQCSNRHTASLLELILKNTKDGDKASLRDAVKSFMVVHWPGECEEIIAFFISHMDQLVDEESEVASEFQSYVNGPPEHCRCQTEKIFGLNTTEDPSSDWKDTYGTEPLEWLQRYVWDEDINPTSLPRRCYDWVTIKVYSLHSYFNNLFFY